MACRGRDRKWHHTSSTKYGSQFDTIGSCPTTGLATTAAPCDHKAPACLFPSNVYMCTLLVSRNNILSVSVREGSGELCTPNLHSKLVQQALQSNQIAVQHWQLLTKPMALVPQCYNRMRVKKLCGFTKTGYNYNSLCNYYAFWSCVWVTSRMLGGRIRPVTCDLFVLCCVCVITSRRNLGMAAEVDAACIYT